MKNRRQQIQNNAGAQFWTDVEGAVPRLLEVAATPASLGLECGMAQDGVGTGRSGGPRVDAYERACPHETPRQIRAYAMGLRELLSRAPSEQATKR